MADVLNRTTKAYLQSVNTPDYPVIDWIIEPDLTAISGFPSIYWIISGDNVLLMSQVERDAVDAALLDAQRDELANDIDRAESFMKAFALVVLDEFNNLRSQHGLAPRTIAQLKNAVRSKLNG